MSRSGLISYGPFGLFRKKLALPTESDVSRAHELFKESKQLATVDEQIDILRSFVRSRPDRPFPDPLVVELLRDPQNQDTLRKLRLIRALPLEAGPEGRDLLFHTLNSLTSTSDEVQAAALTLRDGFISPSNAWITGEEDPDDQFEIAKQASLEDIAQEVTERISAWLANPDLSSQRFQSTFSILLDTDEIARLISSVSGSRLDNKQEMIDLLHWRQGKIRYCENAIEACLLGYTISEEEILALAPPNASPAAIQAYLELRPATELTSNDRCRSFNLQPENAPWQSFMYKRALEAHKAPLLIPELQRLVSLNRYQAFIDSQSNVSAHSPIQHSRRNVMLYSQFELELGTYYFDKEKRASLRAAELALFNEVRKQLNDEHVPEPLKCWLVETVANTIDAYGNYGVTYLNNCDGLEVNGEFAGRRFPVPEAQEIYDAFCKPLLQQAAVPERSPTAYDDLNIILCGLVVDPVANTNQVAVERQERLVELLTTGEGSPISFTREEAMEFFCDPWGADDD